ncbi:MAG: enoyl-CoA hydratase/isomerase family protein [Pseudomonadota bacterium]
METVNNNGATSSAKELDERVTLRIDERGVAWVTLNRPEKHNAFDDQMIDQLSQCFCQLAATPDVRATVVGSAGKSFCAGADLAWMRRMAGYDFAENERDALALAEMLRALNELPMPTIARVQGSAFGGAVGLISCCDIALASEDARFGLTEVKIGLIPATIGPYVLEAIGQRWSRRLFLSGEIFDADRALNIGLVHEQCASHELDHCLEEQIDVLLKNGPRATRAAKALIKDFAGRPIDDQVRRETSRRIAEQRTNEEGQEGLSAFLEKRKPGWVLSPALEQTPL